MIAADPLSDEMMLALGYAPSALRGAFEALLRLDARLGSNVRAASEPQLARIRLAWWRDELEAVDRAPRSVSDPVLAGTYELLRRRDVTPGNLIRIIDGWDSLLEALPLTPETLQDYARARGGGLFAAAAALSGSAPSQQAGEAFALIDFARSCSDTVSRDRALSLASRIPAETLSRALHPFALIDDWARRDAVRLLAGRLPMSLRRRAVSALTFSITGPRS